MNIHKIIFKILVKGSIGAALIYFTNIYTFDYDIQVGVNAINGIIIGVLGFMGYIMLYLLVIIDKWL